MQYAGPGHPYPSKLLTQQKPKTTGKIYNYYRGSLQHPSPNGFLLPQPTHFIPVLRHNSPLRAGFPPYSGLGLRLSASCSASQRAGSQQGVCNPETPECNTTWHRKRSICPWHHREHPKGCRSCDKVRTITNPSDKGHSK